MEKTIHQKKILEVALLAGQIMCESNAESYRVEDTMNRILTYSKSAYAVAVSFSTSIYALLDDPTETNGSYVGIKRITRRSNNLNKISQVNTVSRKLLSGKITVDEALTELQYIRSNKPQYNTFWSSVGVVGLAVSFCVIFGGTTAEVIGSFINGIVLAFVMHYMDRYLLNEALQNVVQSTCVTIGAYLLYTTVLKTADPNAIIIASLMPMVPGTAITNSLRDIFREDYLAGGARMMEAFFSALMIALGSVVGLAVMRSVIL
ncbi:MAG: threonine/serine exporter family protein [Aerococcus sp.]|nr:threonine/serine exporter family protein [Aerococcus sp.]